jgi:hypothetical protein
MSKKRKNAGKLLKYRKRVVSLGTWNGRLAGAILGGEK